MRDRYGIYTACEANDRIDDRCCGSSCNIWLHIGVTWHNSYPQHASMNDSTLSTHVMHLIGHYQLVHTSMRYVHWQALAVCTSVCNQPCIATRSENGDTLGSGQHETLACTHATPHHKPHTYLLRFRCLEPTPAVTLQCRVSSMTPPCVHGHYRARVYDAWLERLRKADSMMPTPSG